MTPLATLLWLLNLLCDTGGHLAFKGASVTAAHVDGIARWRVMFRSPFMWLGLTAFVAEFFLWLAFLSLVPLSQGVLVGCINIIGVMIGGRLFFGERITAARTGAIALVALGVLLVGWGGQ